jgi:hypothetical protein
MLKRLLPTILTLASLGLATPVWAEPAAPIVIISSVQVVEGNTGLTAFEVSVSLSPYGLQGTYTVDVDVAEGSATSDDYIFRPARLVVTAGAPPQLVRGFVVGDAAFEGDEAFGLHASAAPGTPFVVSQDGRVVIVDDDDSGIPFLSVEPTTTVQEGSAGWRWIEVPVRLSAPAAHIVTFTFETQGGQPAYYDPSSGRVYGDYRELSSRMDIPPGETLAKIPLEIYGDATPEPDASFSIWVLAASGAVTRGNVGKVLILDDDMSALPSEPAVRDGGAPAPDGASASDGAGGALPRRAGCTCSNAEARERAPGAPSFEALLLVCAALFVRGRPRGGGRDSTATSPPWFRRRRAKPGESHR